MIRRTPMGYIRRPLNTGSRSTKYTAFIQCFDGQYPQIHVVWILGLDRIICKVHHTDRVEVITVTVKEFVTDYLAGNRRRIQIIGQISINCSIQFWGVPVQSWGRGFPFLCNLQATTEPTGWGSCHTSNQNCVGIMSSANSIASVAWGYYVDPCLAYLLRSLVNSCAT